MKKLIFSLLFTVGALFLHAQQDSTLKEYTGIYKFPEGTIVPQVELVLTDGVLIGHSIQGSAAFERVSRDTFSIPSYNGMAYFTRTSEGKLAGIKIEVEDMVLEGKREEER